VELRPDDLFLFFFSGHGIESGDQSYLLLRDGRHMYPQDTGLSMRLLRDNLARLEAGRRVLLIDACRNDPRAGKGAGDNCMGDLLSRDIRAVAKATPRRNVGTTALLCACGAGQRAYEWPAWGHGVFTHYLLEGMDGAAWKGKSLEFQHLAAYTQGEVQRWSEKTPGLGVPQEPWFEQFGVADSIVMAEEGRTTAPAAGKKPVASTPVAKAAKKVQPPPAKSTPKSPSTDPDIDMAKLFDLARQKPGKPDFDLSELLKLPTPTPAKPKDASGNPYLDSESTPGDFGFDASEVLKRLRQTTAKPTDEQANPYRLNDPGPTQPAFDFQSFLKLPTPAPTPKPGDLLGSYLSLSPPQNPAPSIPPIFKLPTQETTPPAAPIDFTKVWPPGTPSPSSPRNSKRCEKAARIGLAIGGGAGIVLLIVAVCNTSMHVGLVPLWHFPHGIWQWGCEIAGAGLIFYSGGAAIRAWLHTDLPRGALTQYIHHEWSGAGFGSEGQAARYGLTAGFVLALLLSMGTLFLGLIR
jgi:hypothetical protein